MANHERALRIPLRRRDGARWCVGALLLVAVHGVVASGELEPIGYEDPGLAVDLGVGLWAWPAPMDFDGDGDMDLVVACPDKPYNGLYYFENPGGDGNEIVFRPAVRLGAARTNVMPSYAGASWPPSAELLTPGRLHPEFRKKGIGKGVPIALTENPADGFKRKRANQWRLVDLDRDGVRDLVIGIGDWEAYGWDDAYDSAGHWTNGPLHGYVYVARNRGTESAPDFGDPERLEAGGVEVDVYGMPSPNFADFDADGDMDLVCGEFVDGLTWFENVGERPGELQFAKGRPLRAGGVELRMELCMIVPVAVDWDGDGDTDLVVGQEDGRVALVTNLGTVSDGMPEFAAPKFFRQEADTVKVGALVTPVGFDWDGDGDEDLVCGDTAGFVSFVERLDGEMPRWAPPVRLSAGGETLRIMAGENGSIQGPCEAKWGYTVLSVADWDHDGTADLMVNSIWGAVVWYRGVPGGDGPPELESAQPVIVEWEGTAPKPAWTWWQPEGKQLVTQWRTTPLVEDIDEDGLSDLVMLDTEGYLAWYRRARQGKRLVLLPPVRLFRDENGDALRMNEGRAGKSGRRKFVMVDFDGDGKRDLIANSRPNVEFLRNVGADESDWRFRNEGAISERVLAGHTTCPTMIDLDGDGERELVVGAEDGMLYRYVP